MRCGSSIVLLALLSASICLAQDTLHVAATTPLAEEARTEFWTSDLRLGCTDAGNTLLAFNLGGEIAGHEVVVIRPSGTVEARIDIRKVPGLEAANIMDFAPGPNGEIYIVAKKIAWEHVEHLKNGATSSRRLYDSVLWLLRFSTTGQFLTKARVKVNLNRVHMAVFPSGSWLAVGYPQTSFRDSLPFWAIIGQNGELVHPVSVPDNVPSEPWQKRGFSTSLLPILGEDGNVYVTVPTDNKPILVVIGADGSIVRTVELGSPSGSWLSDSRLAGRRLIASVPSKENRSSRIMELDIQTGDLLLWHSVPDHWPRLACQQNSSGIVVFGDKGSFDVLGTAALKDEETYR